MRKLLPPSEMSESIRQYAAVINSPGADHAFAAATRCGLWCVAYGDLWAAMQDVCRENERLRRDLAEMTACMSECQ